MQRSEVSTGSQISDPQLSLNLNLSAIASLILHLRPLDSDGSAAGAEVTLSGHNLVVVATKAHASIGPGLEVSLHVDGAARALVLADGPELLEVPGALDGGSVVALGDSKGIVAAVDVQVALALGTGRWVVRAEVLDDVVLNQGVGGPAVDGEVGVAVRVVLAGVVDGAGVYCQFYFYQLLRS